MVALLAPTLSRVARRYESDQQRCGDLQQEMLIALWLSLNTFEGKSSFQNWVNGVAQQVGLQYVAEQRLSRQREEPSADLEVLQSSHDPETIVATRERAVTALRLLGGLRGREREVVLLHLQELELDEMSQAMRICRTQVRETLIRARRRLAKRMKKTEFGAPEPVIQPKKAKEEPVSEPAPRARRTSSSGQGNVYFSEPRTKTRSHGCA
jgi:RNA polymerase sigma factor (sigma-70 family)